MVHGGLLRYGYRLLLIGKSVVGWVCQAGGGARADSDESCNGVGEVAGGDRLR